MMIRRCLAVVVVAAAVAAGAGEPQAYAPVRVVATTEDLASLTREIGGDRVEVSALARGSQDPHYVDPKPSFITLLSRADLLIVVGRELELGWLPPLLTSSRNARIQVGAPGYLDASQNVRILEIPAGQITRAMGDVHPLGNPHYWLDPRNGRLMAQAIRDRLSQLAPADRPHFEARYTDFDRRLTEAERRWDAALGPHRGAKLVTYHRSWPNFMERFGLVVMGYVEPKPGIPPTPSHTIGLIAEMKRERVTVIVVEPYWSLKTPEAIATQVGGRVVVLAPSVGGRPDVPDYIALFDYNVRVLADALGRR